MPPVAIRTVLGVALLLPALLTSRATAQTTAPTVVPAATRIDVLTVEGPIDRVVVDYLDERLRDAEASGSVVVLQVDSAGALNEDGLALADRVANLRVPVIVWVGPVPARASGAAMLLMYAASVAAVAPGSQTGPLYPVDLADPEERPDLRGTIRGWLALHGRDDVRLERLDEALPGAAAEELGVAQHDAVSVPDLLNQLDDTSVRTAAGDVVLRTAIATTPAEAQRSTVRLRFANMGPIARTLHAVATPSFVYVLLVLGLAALAFELTQPGFGFAGVSGVLLLAFAMYGLTIVPFSPVGMVLLLLGIGLLTLDVRRRRLGPISATGIVAFTAGSVLAFADLADALSISPWLIGGAVLGSALYYGFALTVAIQSRDRIVATQRGLIGLVGEARGQLSPDGPVHVKGALWRGRSMGEPIPAGSRVRVRGVDGLVLQVEAESEAAEAGDLIDD